MNDCQIFGNCEDKSIFLNKLKEEFNKFTNDNTARLLKQDGKIAELCCYIKCNLTKSIRELFDGMKLSGELSEIITETVLFDIIDSTVV